LPGLLLDTHALYWLVSGEEPLSDNALLEIGIAQAAGHLFISPISAWELAVAAQKPRAAGRPNLGADSVDRWFRQAVKETTARIVPIQQKIALEAASVVIATGHKDPGDCYVMATARVRHISLVTRDAAMLAIAMDNPGYLHVLAC
jgi:PIN domain nuclease of toxin-antitoxin system